MTKDIQMAMHGFGYIGRVHYLALKTAAIALINCPSHSWRDAVVRSYQSETGRAASKAFINVMERLDDVDWATLDMVDIVSPNDVHGPVVYKAVNAKKPIYCEKPLSARVEESRQLTDAVERAGVVNQVALLNRFHPAVEQAYLLMKQGALGRVLTFRAALLHGSYLDARRPMAWRLQNRHAGGGALMDLGVHMIDLIHHLVGQITEVACETRTFIEKRPTSQAGRFDTVDVDDWALLRVGLDNGAIGTIEVSRVHYGLEQNCIDIVCERGTVHIDLDKYSVPQMHALDVSSFSMPDMLPLTNFRLPAKYRNDVFLASHATALLSFLHRVSGAVIDYPVPTFQDALAAEEVVHRAQLASKTHHG